MVDGSLKGKRNVWFLRPKHGTYQIHKNQIKILVDIEVPPLLKLYL